MGDVDVSVDPLIAPQEQDTKTVTSSSGGRVMSKAAGKAIEAEHTANLDVAKAQEKVGEDEALLQARKADQLAEVSDLAHQQAADQAAEHQAYADRIQAAREAAAYAEDQFANHKFEDYWSHQSVGKHIAAAFPLFVGGVGAAYLGQQNPAAEALNRVIDRDFQKQKLGFDQQREVARMKGADVNELYVQEGHENAALAVKHAKANEATAASMVQAMTEAGVPLEQATNNVAVKKLLAGAEEKRREALQHYDRTFQGSTTKKEVVGGTGADQRAAAKKQADDEKRTVYVNDQKVGLAPSARVVKNYSDRAVAYDQAIKSLEEMQKDLASGRIHVGIPSGADFDNAVLAIASTTTANPSDATTKHEAGTLKNKLGLLDLDAVTKKLDDLRTRQKQFTGTLQPLPGNERSTLPNMTPPGEGGTSPPPARAPRPAPQSVPTSDLAKMRKAHKNGDARFDDILRANGVL